MGDLKSGKRNPTVSKLTERGLLGTRAFLLKEAKDNKESLTDTPNNLGGKQEDIEE